MKIKELHVKFEDETTRVYEYTEDHLTLEQLLLFLHQTDKLPQKQGWAE